MLSELVSVFWVRTNGKTLWFIAWWNYFWVFKYILHYVMHGLLMWTLENSPRKLTISTPWTYYLSLVNFILKKNKFLICILEATIFYQYYFKIHLVLITIIFFLSLSLSLSLIIKAKRTRMERADMSSNIHYNKHVSLNLTWWI